MSAGDAVRAEVRFAVVPEWVVFHEHLTANAVRAYAALARHADADGEAFPGRPKLAARLGWSVDTLDRAIKELVHHGCVTKAPRFTDGGDQTSNLYTVHVTPQDAIRHAVATVVPPRPGGAADLRRGGRTDAATPRRTDAALTRTTLNDSPPTPLRGEPETPIRTACRRHQRPKAWCEECQKPAPAERPWCGECDQATRLREDAQGRAYRCPTCHPLVEPAPVVVEPVGMADHSLPRGDR